jgi:hypothetical protein
VAHLAPRCISATAWAEASRFCSVGTTTVRAAQDTDRAAGACARERARNRLRHNGKCFGREKIFGMGFERGCARLRSGRFNGDPSGNLGGDLDWGLPQPRVQRAQYADQLVFLLAPHLKLQRQFAELFVMPLEKIVNQHDQGRSQDQHQAEEDLHLVGPEFHSHPDNRVRS